MTNVDTETVNEYVSALNSKFENKQANKKNDLSGDYSSDLVSYPTCQGVKNYFGQKVTSWNATPLDTNYPSEKLVHDTLIDSNSTVKNGHGHGAITNDGKIGTDSDKLVITDTGGVLAAVSTVDADHITDDTAYANIGTSANANQSTINAGVDAALGTVASEAVVNVVKQATADSGYASTYYITQNGVQVGAKINIMKDKMFKSVTIETVGATPTSEETSAGMTTGDQYFKFVVDNDDSDDTSNIILPITSVFDLQSADETSLTLSANGVYSVKQGYVEGIVNDYLSAITTALNS